MNTENGNSSEALHGAEPVILNVEGSVPPPSTFSAEDELGDADFVGKARYWGPCTWNNYTHGDRFDLIEWCRAECEKFIIAEEVGELGTPHLQFAMSFKNDRYFTALKAKWPKVSLRKSRKFPAAYQYCKKEGNFVVQNMSFADDPLKNEMLHPWQEFVVEKLEEVPDSRTIHWIWDNRGNTGKSTLLKSLLLNHRDILMCTGKASDCKHMVGQYVMKGRKVRAVFWDIPRTYEKFVSYQAMEEVKNGCFVNTKYECGMCVYNSPHVFVFANFPPDRATLSLDRWKVYHIDGNLELVEDPEDVELDW